MGNTMTLGEFRTGLLADLEDIFSPGEALATARLIMEHVGLPEKTWIADPFQLISHKYQTEVNKITAQLHRNRPIQYILGETEFCGLRMKVNENVLIPRPETEEMVYRILAEYAGRQPRTIDLGTGSGCIAVALASQLQGANVTALDSSAAALSVALENASEHGLQIRFLEGDMRLVSRDDLGEKADLIVSNPPYVTHGEKVMMQPNVLKYEPGEALFVDTDDPLEYYRAVLRVAAFALSEGGTIWVEINEHFGPETMDLFRRAGYEKSLLMKDIHGRDRFIKARKT